MDFFRMAPSPSVVKMEMTKVWLVWNERLPYQMIQRGNNWATLQHGFKRYFKGAEKPMKAIFWLVSFFKGKYGSTRIIRVDP